MPSATIKRIVEGQILPKFATIFVQGSCSLCILSHFVLIFPYFLYQMMSIKNDTIGNALSDEDGMAPDKSPLDGWLDNLLSGK
jgi:hypothetical protein